MTSGSTKRPECPTWCTRTTGCVTYHEAVIGRFGDTLGITSTVDVAQIADEPTVNVWTHNYVADLPTEVVRLAPAEAATLARALGVIESWEDMAAFIKALTKGAALLGDQGDAAVTS